MKNLLQEIITRYDDDSGYIILKTTVYNSNNQIYDRDKRTINQNT